MRRYLALVSMAMIPMLVCCSKKDASGVSSAQSSSEAPTAATLQPRIGGAVVALGDGFAEVLPHADGQIEAIVMDHGGQPLNEPTKASLVAHATAKGGAETDAKLAWEPAHERFVGHAKGGAKLASGPMKLEMTLQGKISHGLLPMVPVVPAPHLGGRLLAVGEVGAEVMAHADGTLSARLWDAQLEPITDKAAAHVEAQLHLAGGKAENIVLSFDAPSAQFKGKTDLSAIQAPFGLSLTANIGGKINTGAIADLAVAGNAVHDGVVLSVGNYSAELVTGAHGLVQAFVMDASGKAHASGDLGVHLEVAGSPAVELKWDAPSACYRANIGANIDTRPLKLRIESAGRAYVGAIARLKVTAEADLHAAAAAEENLTEQARANAHAGINIEPPSVHITPPKLSAGVDALLDTSNGAKANAKANVQAPSIQVKPPSVSAKAGANADAKTGASGKINLGH